MARRDERALRDQIGSPFSDRRPTPGPGGDRGNDNGSWRWCFRNDHLLWNRWPACRDHDCHHEEHSNRTSVTHHAHEEKWEGGIPRPISRVLSEPCDSGRSFLSEYGHPYPLAAYPRCLDRRGLLLTAYSALLQLGFTVPSVLPRTRWALTPPFHPYLRFRRRSDSLWHYPSPLARRPGVTWQRVHGARTFLDAAFLPPRRDRPAEGNLPG